jgi:hypothetical protein
MARAFPPAYCQQFFDENGKPLAAGKLYTYLAGSNTPVLTYKEINGDSPANQNTNPIILDSAGYAKLVLDDDKAYKLVLKDKNDALKFTWDNVTCSSGGGGGTGTTNVSIYSCTQPSWPSASEMYADFEAGRDIVIIRQSFSGESYNVWNLAEVTRRTITPASYKMTFVNDTGDRANRIVFASTDKQSWTETESSVVIPHRQTIAPSWNSLDTSNYHKNTLVYKGDTLYKCKVNAPSSTWTPAEWDETSIAEELFGLEPSDADGIWAHWTCDTWTSVSESATFANNIFSLSGGTMASTQYPHLKDGLYRFTAEIELRNNPNVYPDIENIVVKLKKGSQELRSQTFLFDRSVYGIVDGTTYPQTKWFGGIFRMQSEGDVSIYVENLTSSSHAGDFKCGHLFVNRLGD